MNNIIYLKLGSLSHSSLILMIPGLSQLNHAWLAHCQLNSYYSCYYDHLSSMFVVPCVCVCVCGSGASSSCTQINLLLHQQSPTYVTHPVRMNSVNVIA
jgi:hypothetical protein